MLASTWREVWPSCCCCPRTGTGEVTHQPCSVSTNNIYSVLTISTDYLEREGKVQAGTKNPVYRQTEVSFKQLTDSNQSSVDDMAIIRGQHG